MDEQNRSREIQGLSLLLDIKASLKKKLHRHVICQVERKFQKDNSILNSAYLMQILHQQIYAVHGLLEDVLTGHFQKNTNNIQKLLKIMNRNIKICMQMFQSHMCRFMMHMGQATNSFTNFKKSLPEIRKHLQDFIIIVLNSCYYTHLLGLVSGVGTAEFEQFTLQCKSILKNLLTNESKQYKQHAATAKILLLLMSIDIKHNNFDHAKQQFYEAITYILLAYKTIQQKRKDRAVKCTVNQQDYIIQDSNHQIKLNSRTKKSIIGNNNTKNIDFQKKYRNIKNTLFTMTLVGLINHQRMLIETDHFKGWEIGYAIVDNMEQYMKNNQNGWCKYIRNEQEHYHKVINKGMQQIRNNFVPILEQNTDIFNKLKQQTIMNKKYSMSYFQLAGIKTQKSKLKVKHATHKQTFYSNKANFSQMLNFDNSIHLQHSEIDEKQQETKGQGSIIKKYGNMSQCKSFKKIQNKNQSSSKVFQQSQIKPSTSKSIFKMSKLTSIDWKQTAMKTQFINSVINIPNQDRKTHKTERENCQKKEMASKYKINLANSVTSTPASLTESTSLINKSRRKINYYKISNSSWSQTAKFDKQLIKKKQKHYPIHQLIYDESNAQIKFEKVASSQQFLVKQGKQSTIKNQKQQNQKYSVDLNITNTLIKLLIKNKRRLSINLLVEKYQLAKKRKKIRNYDHEMLEFNLHKSITKLITNRNTISCNIPIQGLLNFITTQKQQPDNQKKQLRFDQAVMQKQNQEIRDEKQLNDAHKKSKQIISQMLKKIKPTHEKPKIKKSIKYMQNYSTFSLNHTLF